MPDTTDTYPTRNITFADLSSLLNAPSQQTAPDQSAQAQPAERNLSKEPVYAVRATHYGYKGDPNLDPDTAAGKSSFGNLTPGTIALTPDLEARTGAQPGDNFVFTQTGTGKQYPVKFGDRTSSALRGRVDFYDPDNSIGDLGDGTLSRPGASGPLVLSETGDEPKSKASPYGLRIASQSDVAAANQYFNSGGDINQLSMGDQIALAMAKDPNFLRNNFEAFYQAVYKPLQQQNGGNAIKQFLDNIGPSIGQTINNLKDAAVNSAVTAKDEATLAYRKVTGQKQGQDYQDILNRVAAEEATESQAEGKALSDTWDFVSGVSNGLFQTSKPLAMWTMGHDAQSRDQIDRTYARALQMTMSSQQDLHNLGNALQQWQGFGYKATGDASAYADLNQKISTAQPNESAVAGTALALSPLNFIGFGAGEDAVNAFRPLFFSKPSQAAEDVAGASAKKLMLDSTQILPETPELSAARPGYIDTRNAQAGVAPQARQAAQELSAAQQNLADRLTSLQKIAGDPGTATGVAANLMKAGSTTLDTAGNMLSKVTDAPDWLADKVSMGNDTVRDALSEAFRRTIFGGFLHHFGPIGGAIETAVEHGPKIAQSVGDILGAMGNELRYGETTLPYWQRVAQKTKYISPGLASFLDSPAIQTATAMARGGAEGAAVGATLGGLQSKGQGGTFAGGALAGGVQGGLFGMAGGGFGQWQKFRDPNEYLLMARGDWKRYRDTLSPTEQQNFDSMSSPNQIMLAQHASHFPDLRVNYVNDPNGPAGFHYTDNANRSNININLAAPDSAIRGTLAHELIHGASTSGLLPEIYDTLLGNPERGQRGQYTALDANGNVDPATGRYTTNQDFANLRSAYLNKMTEMGLPTAHLNDSHIAKEIFAEHGVDYMLSGQAMVDGTSAFRPGLFSEAAMKTALAKLGFTFDGNGKMVGAPGGTISGTGLFQDLQRNPDLMRLAQTYFQTGVKQGAFNSEEQSTRRFTRKDMQNPVTAETWLSNDPQIMRDPQGNVIRNPLTGEPAYRSAKELKEYNAKFANALMTGIQALPESERMDLGYRQTGENSFFVRYLPDHVLDSLAATNEYNPHQIASLRMLSRVLADGGNPGAEIRMFYRKATTPSKRYGSFEGTEKLAVPYGFQVTGQNNVNIKSVDFAQLAKNYQRVKRAGPYKDLWRNESEFDQDAHTYFVNHSKGDPGATGIGEVKRDAINALAGFDTQTHRESNPLVDKMPNSVRPIIKDYSIDRANQISATGAKRPFISEEQYYKMNRNYLPGEPEKIRDAAVRTPDQKIYTGGIHAFASNMALRDNPQLRGRDLELGYTTSSGRFLNHKEALGLLRERPDTGARDYLTTQDLRFNSRELKGLTPLPPDYLPRAAAPAAPPDTTAIPVSYHQTKSGETIEDKIPYGITSAPLVADKQPTGPLSENNFGHVDYLSGKGQKTLTALDKNSAVTTYADRLVDDFQRIKDNPDIMAGKTWYKQVRGLLKKGFGKDDTLFAHLLAATSAGNGVINNWNDALQAYHRYQSGAFDDAIREYKRTGVITEDMKPTKADGKKFYTNSDEVLKVLAGTWLDEVQGPKTPNFFANLFGRGKEATIDKWAARTMRRLGNEGVEGAPEQWRLQPKSEQSVSDLDFAFSQQVFRQAAEKVGMDPHELQAVMWFAEKDLWDKNGWSPKGSAAAEKASYIPQLKAYAEHVTAKPGFSPTTPEAFIAARDKTSRPEFLSGLKAEDLSKHQLFLDKSGTVGAAVDPNGDIQNVFNNSGIQGRGAHAVIHAINNLGGRTLDAFDGHLSRYYAQFGFKETGRVPFDPAQAPANWPKKGGKPDVVFMRHDGYPAGTGGQEGALRRAWDKSGKSWIPVEKAQ